MLVTKLVLAPAAGDGLSPAEFVSPPGRRATRALRSHPVLLVALLTLLGTALLELWRPLFYLTDDNLTGYLPAATEFYRKLWSGQWPFLNEHLYGGHYELLSDPASLSLWSPWAPLVSWVALTRWYYLLPDLLSLCHSLAIACAFCWSGLSLRGNLKLATPDWVIVLLSLSYTFTPFNLMLGSSWIGFLNGQAAFPVIVAAFFVPSGRRAVTLQAGSLVYSLLGGHPHTFVVVCLFTGAVAVMLSVRERDFRPVRRLALAGVAAIVVMSPALLPTLLGFVHSPRAAGVDIDMASYSRMPTVPLVVSYLLGPFAGALLPGIGMHSGDPTFNLSAVFSLANPLVLAALVTMRRPSSLARALLVCLAGAVLLVIRPPWLAEGLSVMPILRSLQWPFREIWVIHAAGHLAVLLGWRVLPGRGAATWRMAGLLGVAAYAFVFLNRAPTFYLFGLDRRLVISGEAVRFWSAVNREFGGGLRVVTAIPPGASFRQRDQIAFSLLGAYNYASAFNFVSQSGYTFTVATVKERNAADRPRPYFHSGAYTVPDARRLVAEDPGLTLVELEGLDPMVWSVTSRAGTRRFVLDPETERVQVWAAPPPATGAPLPPANRDVP